MQYFKKYFTKSIIIVNAAALLYSGVACADIVVVGNPDIKASQLTQKQLSTLYLGKPVQVSGKETLTAISQPSSSPTYQKFYQKVVGMNSDQVNQYWSSQIFSGGAAQPATASDSANAIARVESTPGAVAYVDSSALANAGKSVKILYGHYQAPEEKPKTVARLYNNEPQRSSRVSGYHSMYEAPTTVADSTPETSSAPDVGTPASAALPTENPPAPPIPAESDADAKTNNVNATIMSELQQVHNSQPTAQNVWQIISSQIHLGTEVNRPQVKAQIKWFTSHPHMLNNMIRDATPYIYYVYQETQRRHMPTQFTLLPMVESGYYPYAYSYAGAAGLWQMMPETATDYGLTIDWWYDARRDIITSTNAALNFLVRLHASEKNWNLAAASYNAGEGAVNHAMRENRHARKNTDFWDLPLSKQTRDYVPKLLAIAAIIKDPARYGITMPYVPNTPYFVAFTLKSQIDVSEAAQLANVPENVIVRLNTGMRRFATNLQGKYTLLVPAVAAQTFQDNLKKVAGKPEKSWQYHEIQKGENLPGIAKNYHTSLAFLESINKLKNDVVHVGSGILVPISINKRYENPLNVVQPSSESATIPQSAEFAPMPKVDTWAVEEITTNDILTGQNMKKLVKAEPKVAEAKPAAPQVQLIQPQVLATDTATPPVSVISDNDDLKTLLTKVYKK
jgi:membrane-bound lytic murein transglycosylase D